MQQRTHCFAPHLPAYLPATLPTLPASHPLCHPFMQIFNFAMSNSFTAVDIDRLQFPAQYKVRGGERVFSVDRERGLRLQGQMLVHRRCAACC